ncbi:hypothetical protein EVAR_51238_1 [Eumeta japonica]|uniref:Uncharacterized protein n=1 Tax=Eumeta variegata TaxID=151549 RepID=A0A4C1X138_EUMVA|nr:hypothetical protein EVAR_51238_1 [Eumeta japonica]
MLSLVVTLLTQIVSQISTTTFDIAKPIINRGNEWSFIMKERNLSNISHFPTWNKAVLSRSAEAGYLGHLDAGDNEINVERPVTFSMNCGPQLCPFIRPADERADYRRKVTDSSVAFPLVNEKSGNPLTHPSPLSPSSIPPPCATLLVPERLAMHW